MNLTKMETQNRIRQRVEKWNKTRHAIRYKARVEKEKAANNNENAQSEKNMELRHHEKKN